jgi:hypothetical protein
VSFSVALISGGDNESPHPSRRISRPGQPVPVPVRFNEYSAKFLCRDAKDAAASVRPGIYETSTNIRNPELPLGSSQPGDLGIDDRAQVTLKLGVSALLIQPS